ncbi:polysaccharide biosynthesis tyrosine autokinase [Flavobacterium sp. LMO8]|uniref:GumC family protein n=1 Tax=Flavobacterium sp. LMO8 TaxID=2654244 RepID=UPI0012929C11|nr:tyrosine-protein kinase [Flavobacterium sp. LMO8]MQP24745.1 polysaccharide biosynthesis tyrosine autokinase [Flavobacterium sp. LMO8]
MNNYPPIETDSNVNKEKNFSIREEFDYYLHYWKWFFLSVLVLFISATIYLRYSTPIYKANAKILVKDDKKGGILSELDLFSDMSAFSKIKSNVDNEIEIIKSRTLAEKTVEKLGLNVTYFAKGVVKESEIYPSPIQLQFTPLDKDTLSNSITLSLEIVSPSTYKILDSQDPNQLYSFGKTFKYKNGNCIVYAASLTKKSVGKAINVTIYPVEKVAAQYVSALSVQPLSKNTSVIEISMTNPVVKKAEDYINMLISVYIQDAIDDKNYVAKNTSNFIENRIRKIATELKGAENDTENYQITNKISGGKEEAGLFLQNASEFEKLEIETETQIKIVETMLVYLSKSTISDLVPANILTADVNAAGMIDQYNQLVLQRNRLLKNAPKENPVIKSLEEKIKAVKENINATLFRLKSSLSIQLKDFKEQNAMLSGKLSKVPTIEKEMRGLGRQQQIKESLYLYLLQKREETAISLAVTEPNAKIIDNAKGLSSLVSPKKSIIYVAVFCIALFLPFSVLYIRRLLDTKVSSRSDLEVRIKIPYLGDIPTSSSNEEIMQNDSKSSTAEAIRILRTNVEFLLNKVPGNQSKTIYVTSSVPNEGKTFISVNLASSIALTGKKVLLVGLDIRNPKLDNYLHLPKEGVTNYLANYSLQLQDIVMQHDTNPNLFIVPSGIIPPNPAELLMTPRMDLFFETIKKSYDYIVVDTSPVGLVTDTLIIAKYADAVLYVARAKFTDKRLLLLPEQLYLEHKLPNMAMVLNDTSANQGYGYYGYYGYGVKKEENWLKKQLKKYT